MLIALFKFLHSLLPFYWNFACFTDEDTLGSFHRFRPQFISSADSLPTYYNPYEFDHTCYVECQPSEDTYLHSEDEDNNQPSPEVRKCVSVPFVPPNAFQANAIAKNMANIIKEVFHLPTLFRVYSIGVYTLINLLIVLSFSMIRVRWMLELETVFVLYSVLIFYCFHLP